MKRTPLLFLLCLTLLSLSVFHFQTSHAKNQSSNEVLHKSVSVQSPQYGTGQARLISEASGSVSNIEPVTPVATSIFSSTGQGRVQGTDETFARLIVKAESEGSVRVIVGLNTAFQPEGFLRNTQQVESQREGIAQAQDSLIAQLTGFHTSAITRFTFIPFMAMELDEAGLRFLQNSPDVSSIEEDLPRPLALAESVPLIGGTAAWASGFSGVGQTVAILDSGVDKTHSFMSGKVVSEACYSTTNGQYTSVCPGGVTESTSPGSGVNCPLSLNGDCAHGTHVAGIAAGKGSSFSGVAKDANIISIQVFSQPVGGGRLGAFDSDMIRGLQRVQDLSGSFNVAAVNMSIGGGGFSTNCNSSSPAMKAAIDSLRSLNIATVIASGNDGSTNAISFPACISSAISVGSTDDGSLGTTANTVSGFSNSASFLKLLAPGRWINSSIPGGGFQNFSGTSMATPHVVGAWAVLKSKTPAATVDQVLQALTSTGLSITDPRNGITKPRIKVDAAVNALAPPPPNWALTVASSNPNSGVSISVSPDNNGLGDGTTQFNRFYTNNTEVTLAAPAVAGGSTNFQKWQRNGVDWSTSQLTSVVMDANYTMTAVYGPATGPNVAAYDPILKAPKCGQPGNSCDSGTLLNGRGNISGGPEPNQPNTINNSCSDGSVGTYHVDESVDRIRVATTDGSTLAPGKLVNIEVSYWARSTESDFLDLFYLSDINSSSWTYMTTLRPTAIGSQVGSAILMLAGSGNLQVVRARLRFGAGAAVCEPSDFNDHDDLVFAAPTPPPTLMIESANPVSGVNITVSPNDNNGQGNGTTQFTRIYNNNTIVSLTAPATAGGNSFLKWRVNGADWTTNLSANIAMIAGTGTTTVTAVYVTPQRTLTLASTNPASGVTIALNPISNSGSWDGVTPARLTYNQNTIVSLTAPPNAGGNNFQKWQRNGVDWSVDPATDVTLDANYTMTAVYVLPPQQTLTVASTNPASGVSITVSPNDNSGFGNGTTQFTRTYNKNTTVTLTAPATAGGNNFQKWQQNGVDWSATQATNVTLDANYTMTAVYVPPPQTLTVASTNPASGVFITVSPVDNNSFGSGTTQFSRTYNQNTVVSLRAPTTAGGNNFQKWQRNGVDWSVDPATDVTLDANYTMTAVYVTPQQTLTVASTNPASGVGITVSPNDNSGFGNGTTQFSRTYNQNTVVTLTAPATASGNNFQKWQRNGVDWSTSQATSVTLDANYTMTAVYVTPQQILTVASTNPDSGVGITVSPNDNSGFGNGTTPFNRTYNQNTVVTLTAPATAGGNIFQKWQRNGVDWSVGQATNVTLDANYTMTAVYAPDSTLGLMGYWKFDQNTGTTAADSSGNGNTGTLTSGATWGVGQTGAAVNLDGVDDYVQVGAQASLLMTSAASFTAWIYPTGAGSHATVGGTILAKEGEYVIARFPNGTIQWGFANINPGWQFIDTGYVAPLNQWTHIAVTYDNGTIKTYANGILVHSYVGSGTIGDQITAQNDFRIGGRQVISQQFQGEIDEVRVYNRALTASEINQLGGLVKGYWKFDENSGTTAADLSGNGNTGTLNSGATWTSGQSGAAVNLDGVSGYVKVKDGKISTFTTGTISAWVKANSLVNASKIVCYGGATAAPVEGIFGLEIRQDGSNYYFAAIDVPVDGSPSANIVHGNTVLQSGVWYHVALTSDGSSWKLYVNGVPETLTPQAGNGNTGKWFGNTSVAAPDKTYIGGAWFNGFDQGFFNGVIDEVRIYDRALPASEIANLAGLVGYWKFDENTGTAAADSSGNGNTGTLTAGATWGVGQTGAAVNLDGVDDYVQVGAQSSLLMTSAASFTAWIYPTGAGSHATVGGTILCKEGEYVIARFPNGTIQWGFANSNPGWQFINTGYVAPLNQWTHIAVTYDNGTIKTYANGILVHSYVGSGTIGDQITVQNDFRIGGRQVISQQFQGEIDEVRVYNRALTAGEIGVLVSH